MSAPLMTIEELEASPLVTQSLELIAGVIRPSNPTGGPHGVVASNLLHALTTHVFAHRLGAVFTAEVGFVLRRSPDTLRCPNVAFVSAEKLPAGGVAAGFIDFAPDLAAEVVSPGDSPRDIAEKVSDYLAAGTRLVWVVDPRTRQVTVHGVGADHSSLGEGNLLDGGIVLPGFRCPVSALFALVAREAGDGTAVKRPHSQ